MKRIHFEIISPCSFGDAEDYVTVDILQVSETEYTVVLLSKSKFDDQFIPNFITERQAKKLIGAYVFPFIWRWGVDVSVYFKSVAVIKNGGSTAWEATVKLKETKDEVS